MLELGIDEFTIVLQLAPKFKSNITAYDWQDIAQNIIYKFETHSDFIAIFGEQQTEKKAPEGYTYAFTYGEHSFYLAVAYHEYRIDMGVVIKFSAQSLDYYCEATGLKPYELLQKIQDRYYIVRLSRVDLTVDYINEDIDVTMIYQHLMNKKIAIFREYKSKKSNEILYKRCDMSFNGFLRGQEVPTIYLGSAKSNSRLRIYDKKREQIERKGTKYDKAVKCNDWVRFEGVCRNEYAHQLSEAFMSIKSDDEYSDLIASTMLQKYRFMFIDNGVMDCDTEYSQLLINCINNKTFVLKSSSTKNYEIVNSISHIFFGSGVINTLYKIKAIWGDSAVDEFLSLINDYLDEFVPNDDCKYWLRKNKQDMRIYFPDFDKFLKDNIYPML